ncbi:MAG: ABC transporter permease [Acidimicrobiia bacterium]|nr:ABC transporter permease [Acidimicrobiia bacterium]MYC44002.1 ABC transporter permease [Acidimicrobiia bacterium]MYI20476.1 ABC transporter permease [Acidimicrobiia bacterium]
MSAGSRGRLRVPETVIPVLAILVSLVVLAPLVQIGGAGFAEGYRELFKASFGSMVGVGSWLTSSLPLVLVGLGVALPYRAGLFNVGGEGQLLTGALVGVYIGTAFGGGPGAFLLPLVAAFGSAGALGAVAGWLKARGMHEIVTTIMFNFIAFFSLTFLLRGGLKDPDLPYAASRAVSDGFRLGRFAGDDIPYGIFIAIVVVLATTYFVDYTRLGWRLGVLGQSDAVAVRQGINLARSRTVAMALGGGLAGLGGVVELLGNQYRIGAHFSPGWGFTAVAVALLARGKMLPVVPFALYFGFLQNGEVRLQAILGLPGNLVLILVAAPVIIVAAVYGFRAYRRTVMVGT